MKQRILKKRAHRILNSYLPTTFKLSAIHALITKVYNKKKTFTYNNVSISYSKTCTTNHIGIITVNEYDGIYEIGFSSFKSAMIWICKYGKHDCEYRVDSGEYCYNLIFNK